MLRLTLQSKLTVPLEAPCIAPDRLAGLSTLDIAKLAVQHGNRAGELGQYFAITGDAADAQIEIDGDCSRVKWLGASMSDGRLVIRRSAGMHAGSAMTGGSLEILEDADDWLGAEMRSGVIRVHGHAGHHAGAALPGNRIGMRGGAILIDGPAGDGCGAVMRRGLIAAGGCGEFAGASMVAGSLFVFGALGKYAGMAMKRGTIGAFGPAPELLPTFCETCRYSPSFLHLYAERLRELGYSAPVMPGAVRRFCGDGVSLGLGEILLPALN